MIDFHHDTQRYMRSGNHIEMLSRMGELMPSVFIDGELWYLLFYIFKKEHLYSFTCFD